MKQLDGIKQTMLSEEKHLAFLQSLKENGRHDYSVADTDGKGVKIYASKPTQ